MNSLWKLWKCYSTPQFGATLLEEEILKGNFELIRYKIQKVLRTFAL